MAASKEPRSTKTRAEKSKEDRRGKEDKRGADEKPKKRRVDSEPKTKSKQTLAKDGRRQASEEIDKPRESTIASKKRDEEAVAPKKKKRREPEAVEKKNEETAGPPKKKKRVKKSSASAAGEKASGSLAAGISELIDAAARATGSDLQDKAESKEEGLASSSKAKQDSRQTTGVRNGNGPQELQRSRSRSRQRSRSRSMASSSCDASSEERRQARRESAGLRPASGFGLSPPPPPPEVAPGQLVPLPEKVKGLLEHQKGLEQEVLKMKLAVEAATGVPVQHAAPNDESTETTLKMATRLAECLLHPDNQAKLLAKTGLLAASLSQEKHVILRAASRKGLNKALGVLKRVAYHCQWGCSVAKVGSLLAQRSAKPVNSLVLRLAATTSYLQSHDARLSATAHKLRIGTQAELVLEGIPGLSRKHCTITFEAKKGCCYIQDLSTNGTYLNGRRLPRPPYKNPTDARVRLFHGDELMFKLRTAEDKEELGYVVNLVELN